jgi:hypothetical protein
MVIANLHRFQARHGDARCRRGFTSGVRGYASAARGYAAAARGRHFYDGARESVPYFPHALYAHQGSGLTILTSST